MLFLIFIIFSYFEKEGRGCCWPSLFSPFLLAWKKDKSLKNTIIKVLNGGGDVEIKRACKNQALEFLFIFQILYCHFFAYFKKQKICSIT